MAGGGGWSSGGCITTLRATFWHAIQCLQDLSLDCYPAISFQSFGRVPCLCVYENLKKYQENTLQNHHTSNAKHAMSTPMFVHFAIGLE